MSQILDEVADEKMILHTSRVKGQSHVPIVLHAGLVRYLKTVVNQRVHFIERQLSLTWSKLETMSLPSATEQRPGDPLRTSQLACLGQC